MPGPVQPEVNAIPVTRRPAAKYHLFGIPIAAIGFIFGAIAIYTRFVYDVNQLPTMVLSSLLIIMGVQSVFFGMVLEMEMRRTK